MMDATPWTEPEEHALQRDIERLANEIAVLQQTVQLHEETILYERRRAEAAEVQVAQVREALERAVNHEELHTPECRTSGIEYCWLDQARVALAGAPPPPKPPGA